MHKFTKHYRQGDVLILKLVDEVPETAKPAADLVLAHGEATGHMHQIRQTKHITKSVKKFVAERLQYLATKVKAKVQHEEHTTIALPAGNFAVLIQTEYTPSELRQVID